MSNLAKSTKSPVELLDDEDRISDLPDGIMCHILSFLDTKDAVATTILSTKWMNLWTTAPINIDFDDEKTYGIKFARLVDKVFHSHNLPIIKRFSLCCLLDPVYNVHSWVKMAILKKVQDLTLEIENNGDGAPITLPTSFLTCETLEVLMLQGPIIVRMAGLGSLPKLKNLALENIQYENDECAHMLISSCPSLEKLQITRDEEDGAKNFIIRSSATLKHLTIYHVIYESDYSYVINSPGLQQLVLGDVPIHGFVIENLSSLVKTEISFSNVLYIGLHDDNIHSLLRGFSNSKNLRIILDRLQSHIPAHLLPKFGRLSTLELYMNCCKWHLLQEYIKNSDRLEVLNFLKHSCGNKKHLVCWRWNPKTVPICLLSSLKTMTFIGFDGLKDELRMVKYMLKNAKVMQKMDIRFEYSLQNTESASQLRQKLLKFSKGSEECQVVIS